MAREWYVYDYTHNLVLSGWSTEEEAAAEVSRILREAPDLKVATLRRDEGPIIEYARTHPHWAEREGFEELLIREGDIGTLTEDLYADDTAGVSHLIPAGMEVKIARVEPTFIGFYTGEVIEGENYFVTPLTMEFRRKFKKRETHSASGASGEEEWEWSKGKKFCYRVGKFGVTVEYDIEKCKRLVRKSSPEVPEEAEEKRVKDVLRRAGY